MIQKVTKNEFINIFKQRRPDNFTYEALELIFDFITEYENDTNMNVELDVIAICCDFSEMTKSELIDAYPDSGNSDDSIIKFLENKTLFLGTTSSNTFVFQDF